MFVGSEFKNMHVAQKIVGILNIIVDLVLGPIGLTILLNMQINFVHNIIFFVFMIFSVYIIYTGFMLQLFEDDPDKSERKQNIKKRYYNTLRNDYDILKHYPLSYTIITLIFIGAGWWFIGIAYAVSHIYLHRININKELQLAYNVT